MKNNGLKTTTKPKKFMSLLVLAAVLSLSLSGAKMDVAWADAAPADPDAPGDDPSRLLHVRIFEPDGSLLYSSWPDEWGSLQHADPNVLKDPWKINASTEVPGVFDSLRGVWPAAPAHAVVTVENLRLDPARVEHLRIPRTISIPSEAEVPRAEAERLFSDLTEGSVVPFAGRVPIQLVHVDDARVHYRLLSGDGDRFDVERTVGLHLHVATGPSDGTVTFRLEAPSGDFETLGCRIIPGHSLDPGYYRVLEQDDEHFLVAKYAEHMEHVLEGRLVTFEAHFLN
jgi:hypothetical protein